jgi:menaquinone-dependent protoporphyrinogen oxidase
MNVLVIYATRLGSTRGIAERIAARLKADGLAATAAPVRSVTDLRAYDAFVVGSAVYAGHWLIPAGRFIEDNQAVLASRPVWLFSSGPVGSTATSKPPVSPLGIEALGNTVSARGHRIFAGAFDRNTLDEAALGKVERFIAKRFVPEGDFRAWPEIDAWADEIARDLSVAPAGRP